jgi:Ca2+-binding EF-hand superfamily protein
MKRFLPVVLLSFSVVAAPADFEHMDGDRDGRISAAEHAAATRQMFEAMDADGDGKVTAAEMEKFSPASGMSAAEKIKVVDTDGDGVLTAAEHAVGSRMMFGSMDANRDGHLSRSEWTAGHAALAKKRE